MTLRSTPAPPQRGVVSRLESLVWFGMKAFPVKVGAVVVVLFLLWSGAADWVWLVAFPVTVVAVVATRGWERRRRMRLRARRAWAGTPDYVGIAASIGLVNAQGRVPDLIAFGATETGRRATFRVVPGIGLAAIVDAEPVIREAFGAVHSVSRVERAGGLVVIDLIDNDALAVTRDATLGTPPPDSASPQRVSPGESTAFDGVPYWEAFESGTEGDRG